MKIRNIIISVVALVAIGGVGYGWIHADNVNHSLRTQSRASDCAIDQRNQAIHDKSQMIQSQFQRERLTNSDPKISSVFLQNERVQQASKDITKLFRTYYDYGNGTEYSRRGDELLKQGLITKQLADDHQLFGSDIVASGNHYIDQLGLNSSFDHAYSFLPNLDRKAGTLDISTQVEYTSNLQGQSGRTTTATYRLTYDLKPHRITSMRSEAKLFNNLDSLHNLQDNGAIDDY